MAEESGTGDTRDRPVEGRSRAAGGEDAALEEHLVALLDSFVARFLKGERPSISEFAKRAPELSQRIHELFPALELLGEVQTGASDAERAEPMGTVRDPPQKLGDYRLLREVGRGGMGVVYEAEQRSLGRRVALKILPFHALTGARHIERFQNEARAAAGLQHPGIVPVYGLGEEGGIHYYAMQFVEGESLDRVLAEVRRIRGSSAGVLAEERQRAAPGSTSIALALLRDRFDPVASPAPQGITGMPDAFGQYFRCAARVMKEAAEALGYAHDRGLLHRDIKPSNVMVDMRGHAWVADFGLAKAKEGVDLTTTGEIVGTLRYMAPERFKGECDRRSEVYSLGLTLYEILTTEPAFPGDDRATVYTSIAEKTPLSPRELDPRIPRELERIVLKSIQKVPAQRYGTMAEVAQDLARFLEGRPVLARLPGVGSSVRAFWKRRRRLVSAAVLMLLGVIGLLAWSKAIHRPDMVQHFVAADVDGDGDADLITANAGSGSVSVLLNSGEGAFSLAGHYAVGKVPTSVGVARLDGNESVDLVTANFQAGTISVLCATGKASYVRRDDIDIGVQVNFAVPVDLDRDGDCDLVVTSKSSRAFILENQGDARFAKPLAFETLLGSNIVLPVDLDGDRDEDLVISYCTPAGHATADFISVFYNAGDGRFDTPVNRSVGAPPWGLAAADIDRDGDLDLAVAHGNSNGFTILFGRGDRTFEEEPRSYTVRSAIQSIAAADLTGDEIVDLAVTGNLDYVAVLPGIGDGTFKSPVELSGAVNTAWVEAVDIDNDGDLDLIVSNYTPSSLTVFRNDGKGAFEEGRMVSLSSWWKFLRK